MEKKKCKGTGKAKGHGCEIMVMWRRYGLCKRCFSYFCLYTPEGNEVMNKSIVSAKKKVQKEKRKEDREYKEKHKSIAKLIQEARKPFQAYIRQRDANLLCCSCGKHSETWNASHFYKAELYTGLILDERNVHKGCVYCNKYLDGNLSEYRKRLIKRFGSDWMAKLDEDAIKLKSYKYTREELISIKEHYKKLLK